MTSWRTHRRRFGEKWQEGQDRRRAEEQHHPRQWIEAILDELIQTKEEWSQFHRQTSIEHGASLDSIHGVSRMTKQEEVMR